MGDKTIKPKSALITGANGAIGLAISQALFRMGYKLHLVGSKTSQFDPLDVGVEGVFYPVNLEHLSEIDQLITEIKSTDEIDILINCAGVAIDNLFLRVSDEEWDMQIRINLTASWKLSKLLASGMCKKGWGRIVSISSVIGHLGNAGQAAYAASKAGLFGMTKSLAREVAARGVTVNTVSPGFIESPMTEKIRKDEVRSGRILTNIPMGYFGKTKDVVAAVEFLISDGARYVTGTDISVSGGMYM